MKGLCKFSILPLPVANNINLGNNNEELQTYEEFFFPMHTVQLSAICGSGMPLNSGMRDISKYTEAT